MQLILGCMEESKNRKLENKDGHNCEEFPKEKRDSLGHSFGNCSSQINEDENKLPGLDIQ